MATRSSRQPSKYPAPQDVANASQLGKLDLELPGLTWPDGRPMVLLLSARTHEQRAACNRAAIKAAIDLNLRPADGLGAPFDDDTYAVWTAFYGIEQPRFTPAQLPIIWSLNAHVLEEIVDAIEQLERLPAAALKAKLELLANTPIPSQEKPTRRKVRPPDPADLDSSASQEAE